MELKRGNNSIELEENYVLEYIKDTINDIKLGIEKIDDARFHHNTKYEDAPSLCKNGILSIRDMQKLGLVNYTEKELEMLDDIESHANGIDCVSLSVVGVRDLYPGEFEYESDSPLVVDFRVSSDISVGRYTENYANEFLSYKSISNEQFKSLDIRLLKLIENLENNTIENVSVKDAIDKFNCLKKITLAIEETKLLIPIREMSKEDEILLDKDKLLTLPKLKIK